MASTQLLEYSLIGIILYLLDYNKRTFNKITQNYTKIVFYSHHYHYIYEGGGSIKDLIPLKEACKIIGVSYKTLYNWVSNNEVSYTKVGNRYYLSQEQLNALVFVFNKS